MIFDIIHTHQWTIKGKNRLILLIRNGVSLYGSYNIHIVILKKIKYNNNKKIIVILNNNNTHMFGFCVHHIIYIHYQIHRLGLNWIYKFLILALNKK